MSRGRSLPSLVLSDAERETLQTERVDSSRLAAASRAAEVCAIVLAIVRPLRSPLPQGECTVPEDEIVNRP